MADPGDEMFDHDGYPPGFPHHADPITEDWLKAAGFKWHQFERQPGKHWLLWLGGALLEKRSFTSFEDIGLELAADIPAAPADWFCWLRSDAAGRYHRFIHLRHLTRCGDVVALIEAITGRSFDPKDCFYGSMYSPQNAERVRRDLERADVRLREQNPKWSGIEEDDTRGRALPEHMAAHAKARGEIK